MGAGSSELRLKLNLTLLFTHLPAGSSSTHVGGASCTGASGPASVRVSTNFPSRWMFTCSDITISSTWNHAVLHKQSWRHPQVKHFQDNSTKSYFHHFSVYLACLDSTTSLILISNSPTVIKTVTSNLFQISLILFRCWPLSAVHPPSAQI